MRGTTPRWLVVGLAVLTIGSFAAAQAVGSSRPSSAGTPRLVASPTAVRPGASLRLRGTGFPADARLALLVGPPHARASRIGSAVTGSTGSFVATIRIRARAAPGALVALACHDACRVKATARFRNVRG